MRRRDLLRVGGTALVAGTAGAHPTPTPTGNGTGTGADAGAGTATATGGTPVDGVEATPAGYGPLGTVGLPKAKEAVVGTDGTTVFVAVTDGFAVVDAAEPRSPRVVYENRSVLSDVADGPLTYVFDVKVDGDLLAVTGPANPSDSDTLKAVAVYDVSDPTDPQRISFHRTDNFNHNCFVRNGVVYLCGNDLDREEPNALITVDATSGEELGRWSVADVEPGWADVSFPLWVVHDVWVGGEIAYLAYWDAGTWMVDVSDPGEPELVGKVRGRPPGAFADLSKEEANRESSEPPGNDHLVQASDDGTLVVIGVEAWDVDPEDGTGHPGGIHLYDRSTPDEPEKLAFIEAPPTPDPTLGGLWTTSHNFDLVGDRLYTSWYRGGMRIYDVSDPASPDLLAAWRNDATTSFWTAQRADGFVVASSRKHPSGGSRNGQEDGAAIYTFPNPHGETPTDTPTGAPSDSPDGGSTGNDPTATEVPGFGPGVALAGAGIGAWRYLRRRGE